MSKPISVTIPHQLGQAEAKARVEAGFGDLARHLGAAAGALHKSWDGDRLNFSLQAMGQGISGSVNVAANMVVVEVLLPGFLAMLAGKVKGALRKEGQLLLERRGN